MNKCIMWLVLVMPGIAVGFAGKVFANESHVQGIPAMSGNSVVIGDRNGVVSFAVTGLESDVLSVTPATPGLSRMIPPATIRQLATAAPSRIAPLVRISATRLPDGQVRVLLSFRPTPDYNGGAVTLRRGNTMLDSDPIQLNRRR
jgi:hypothetical protein